MEAITRGPIPVLPIDVDNIKSLAKKEGMKALQNKTIVVDFSKSKSFTDPNLAGDCLEVLCVTGDRGSLTHLQVNADISSFANKLAELHGRNPPICFSGTNNSSRPLLEDTVRELSNLGFAVSLAPEHSDVGGVHYRKATLYKDQVLVVRDPYSITRSDITLKFPN